MMNSLKSWWRVEPDWTRWDELRSAVGNAWFRSKVWLWVRPPADWRQLFAKRPPIGQRVIVRPTFIFAGYGRSQFGIVKRVYWDVAFPGMRELHVDLDLYEAGPSWEEALKGKRSREVSRPLEEFYERKGLTPSWVLQLL